MRPSEIIAEARTWLGTPFHHQGRVKGVGVDCIGLVVGVGRDLGLVDYDTTDYGRIPNPVVMGKGLREHLIQTDQIVPGCVLWFAFTQAPMHLGIVTDSGLIHAYATAEKVVETGLDEQWVKRTRGVFLFPGVNY